MSKLARAALSAAARCPAAPSGEGRSMAEALEERWESDRLREQQSAARPDTATRLQPQKMFSLHVGGELQLPMRTAAAVKASPAAAAAASPKERDVFDGVPLRAWAEALGERVMPAYELIKEEARASKTAAARPDRSSAPAELKAPSVPHFLPFTRWAAQSKVMQDTFVVDEKNKKKARLSWYHPDDTMVPRDWFRGGLLKDLAYYKPFSSSS
ncbi:hypothetical protein WJX81_007179 [Elliptochloris bilobata]|uniref:Uncharacterized protein n=1 Tax=Elliptochloris bilobata TaxID=381761 RepID=A0AAW1RX12_9CHLO